jgi:hypothetical protein
MKTSEATKDENAVTSEGKQGNDASLNEVETPDLPGEGLDIANGSMSCDMTKTQESVDQVLKVFPAMAGCRITPVLVFWILRDLHWVEFTFETGFGFSNSWITLPAYGSNRNRNILDFRK